MRGTRAIRVIPAVVAVVCACVGAATRASAEPKRVVAAPRPPVVFEEARGRLDPRTAFVSRNRHFSLAIASNEVLLAPKTSGTAPMRMRFVGGASDAVVSGVNPLPGTIYYVDGRTAGRPSPVHTYDRVSAARVYPGIDVEYYATDEQLEFDFVIAPYADPRRIRLAFTGAAGIEVSENGDLAMRVGGEELRLKKPVIYQRVGGQRRSVTGRFVLGADQTASLALGPYDRSLPLIVDPVVTFATYLGSAGDDTVVSLQSDSAGNVYIFGRTFDQTTFPP